MAKPSRDRFGRWLPPAGTHFHTPTSKTRISSTMTKSNITYLDGVWYKDEADEFYPINRYEAVDMLIKAINAAQENKLGTVMEILDMDESYSVADMSEIIATRMKELSVQAQLELEIPPME